MRLPRLQFSLRTLVILVVIVAACASWHGARYARYRGRVAARVELEHYGVYLITQFEDPEDKRPKPELTFAERWDLYWFGEVAVLKFGSVFIDERMLLPAYEARPQIDFREQLRLFPEIDYLGVGMASRFSDRHYNDTPDMNETRLLPRNLMLAILALPQLTELHIDRLSAIDAEVAAVFPHNSPLVGLSLSEVSITPDAWRTILARAPRLRQVSINQHAFDPAIVAELNRTGWPRPGSETTDENNKRSYLVVDIIDSRPASTPTLEPSLRDLKIPYSLEVHSLSTTTHDPQADPLVLDGYHAEHLNCKFSGNLRLQNFPQLKQMMLSNCQNVELRECPLLHRAMVEHARYLLFEQLANLDHLIIYQSAEFEIRACPALERFWLDRVGQAKISDLPNLNHLDFQGKTFELSNLPKLESVELIQPTLEQLQALRKQLPGLKYLALEFEKPVNTKPFTNLAEQLPATTLTELQEFPALVGLQLNGRILRTTVDTVEFFRPLNKLPQLKLLWIEKHEQLPEWLAGDASFLPPTLEVLLTDTSFANEDQRAAVLRKYPDLLYVVRCGAMEKALGLDRPDLEELPAKDALVPFAERLRPTDQPMETGR